MDRVGIGADINLVHRSKSLGRLSVEFIIRDDVDILRIARMLSSERFDDFADDLKVLMINYLNELEGRYNA